MNLKINWNASCDTEEEDASGYIVIDDVGLFVDVVIVVLRHG